jgi:hypothetical protein
LLGEGEKEQGSVWRKAGHQDTKLMWMWGSLLAGEVCRWGTKKERDKESEEREGRELCSTQKNARRIMRRRKKE